MAPGLVRWLRLAAGVASTGSALCAAQSPDEATRVLLASARALVASATAR